MTASQILGGARVEHRGMALAWVESVLADPAGELAAVLVRHGRANYLLRIPGPYLVVESPSVVRLDSDLELDDMERTAVESGLTPPIGEHFTDGGPTEPTPVPMEVLGQEPGFPPWYEPPGTG